MELNNPVIVSVDTGNKNIKTPHTEPFNAGLINHGHTQPPLKAETICYNGKYYSLTESRLPVAHDKTNNDNYYILTLFAIAKELKAQNIPYTDVCVDIQLSVGLPPRHLQQLKDSYVGFFMKEKKEVTFVYNDEKFRIRIVGVDVSPQGYAAVIPFLHLPELKNKPRSYIIDIGGFTTDVIMLKRGGTPDLSLCESFTMGVIRMFDDVQCEIRNKFVVDLDDYMVDALLRGELSVNEQVRSLAKETVRKYGLTLIGKLKEKGVDFSMSYPIFIGGGSLLLKDVFLSELGYKEKDCLFIEDVKANAIGYDAISKMKRIRGV